MIEKRKNSELFEDLQRDVGEYDYCLGNHEDENLLWCYACQLVNVAEKIYPLPHR
jgi:hypothetical protein